MDVYGLIGTPVEHSLSPPMHEAAYEALGIDARYVSLDPDPDGGRAAVESAATLGFRGLNVTIPFKRDVLAAVEADDLATAVGAVNTVDFATDPPTGYNTDVTGVQRALCHHDIFLEGTAVVVGAGGAGRAAAFALAAEGMRVKVANRTPSKATDLAGSLAAEGWAASGHGLEALPQVLEDADILVNATSVGMDEERSPIPAGVLHEDLTVLDAVYSPLETRLLQDAAAAGATTIDGAWMLLFQGVEAFERWTGREAPVDAMDRALRDRL
ncbi:MAG: shikimate dehydrogenase [Haloarculaceae archaeon]